MDKLNKDKAVNFNIQLLYRHFDKTLFNSYPDSIKIKFG